MRTARLAAGLTLASVAAAVRVSAQTILRHERPQFPPGPHPELLAKHAAAVGMRVRIQAYPEGEPLRDAPQLQLMRGFRARLPAGTPFQTEVPVTSDPRDARAWDAVIVVAGCRCALEFVTRFHDCEAQLRQFQLKLRDGDVQRLVVVVKASRANRRAIGVAADLVATAYPLGTRQVMRALARGEAPGSNGLALI